MLPRVSQDHKLISIYSEAIDFLQDNGYIWATIDDVSNSSMFLLPFCSIFPSRITISPRKESLHRLFRCSYIILLGSSTAVLLDVSQFLLLLSHSMLSHVVSIFHNHIVQRLLLQVTRHCLHSPKQDQATHSRVPFSPRSRFFTRSTSENTLIPSSL